MGFITLDRKSFFNNADYYSHHLGGVNKLCMALKDNAYGHGIKYMGQLCQEYGIRHCIVRDIEEANIASKFDFKSIIILYEIPIKNQDNYPSSYIFGINSLENIKKCPQNTKIELKVDTGMSRNGISLSQVNEVIELINRNKLILNGVFTHFCCADIADMDNKTKKQENLFLNTVNEIKSQVETPFRIHCSNTAGMHKVNHDLYDMARVGIGLYGYSEPCQNSLKPILSLWANKISTKYLNKNDGVGYGAIYKSEKNNMIVSNYDIGYGDGFFRLNERKKAHIKDGRQILGKVSMDSFSIEGDEDKICVFNNVSHLCKVHDTIEYEILTHLLPRIKRTII